MTGTQLKDLQRASLHKVAVANQGKTHFAEVLLLTERREIATPRTLPLDHFSPAGEHPVPSRADPLLDGDTSGLVIAPVRRRYLRDFPGGLVL